MHRFTLREQHPGRNPCSGAGRLGGGFYAAARGPALSGNSRRRGVAPAHPSPVSHEPPTKDPVGLALYLGAVLDPGALWAGSTAVQLRAESSSTPSICRRSAAITRALLWTGSSSLNAGAHRECCDGRGLLGRHSPREGVNRPSSHSPLTGSTARRPQSLPALGEEAAREAQCPGPLRAASRRRLHLMASDHTLGPDVALWPRLGEDFLGPPGPSSRGRLPCEHVRVGQPARPDGGLSRRGRAARS